MGKIAFLSKEGFFAEANLSVRSNQSLDALRLQMQAYLEGGRVLDASLIAQKACIDYGFEGFKLYLPLKIQLLQQDRERGEIIQSELFKTVSLIDYFLQDRMLAVHEQEWLVAQKKMCIKLCQQNELSYVISEAQKLTDSYLHSNSLGRHPKSN